MILVKIQLTLNNGAIESGFGDYEGTDRAVKRQFELKHRTDNIFDKSFLGADSSIVKTDDNVLSYQTTSLLLVKNLLILMLVLVKQWQLVLQLLVDLCGVGTTNKLPSTVYAVKVDDDTIKLAETPAKALKTIPDVVDLTSVGIGTSHRFTAHNQNAKLLVSIDNIIQSPIVSTAVTYSSNFSSFYY